MQSGDEIDLSELELEFYTSQVNPSNSPVQSLVEASELTMPCLERNPWVSSAFTAVKPGMSVFVLNGLYSVFSRQ